MANALGPAFGPRANYVCTDSTTTAYLRSSKRNFTCKRKLETDEMPRNIFYQRTAGQEIGLKTPCPRFSTKQINYTTTKTMMKKASSLEDLRESSSGTNPLLSTRSRGTQAYELESLHESLSSITLDRSTGQVRPRRRTASVQSFIRRQSSQWQRSDSETADMSSRGGYSAGLRRRNGNSSQSLFGLGHVSSMSSNPNEPQPPLPSLGVIASELFLICSLYCKYAIRSLRKPCLRVKQTLFYVVFSVIAFFLLLTAWLAVDFYMDAVQVCTPPSDYEYSDRPLVEYYVHGRGIGHYARSVAIVEQLNQNGVDVRMFLTRAAMWRAMHEDSKTIDNTNNHAKNGENIGTTTAISVAPLTPKHGPFETISHSMERIVGDCEVASQSNRYPHLVISDGDFPGMLRAEFGGIPSVGIAHGQLFSIAQKPSWIKTSPHLNRAWNRQGRLNFVSSFFSEWQIATHFCFLEAKVKTGVVARAPLRPEVINMAVARKWARNGTVATIIPQLERVRNLLVNNDGSNVTSTTSTTPLSHRSNSTTSERTTPLGKRRKLVICYFRDHNGEMVVKALLDAGFDVLLFDNGYFKDMVNDPNRYGVKWVVRDRDEHRRNELLGISGESQKRRLLQDQWEVTTTHVNETQRRFLQETILTSGTDGPRLIRVMDRSLFVPLMHVADGVASSAGSQLMSECIYSHMPLLALYLEQDDEQKLNVQLSRQVSGACHKTQVFGTSFETLAVGLKGTNITSSNSPTLLELKKFVREVKLSRVSETLYQYFDTLGQNVNVSSLPKDELPTDVSVNEDPFHGLPDAAAIIMEIIKQVTNS